MHVEKNDTIALDSLWHKELNDQQDRCASNNLAKGIVYAAYYVGAATRGDRLIRQRFDADAFGPTRAGLVEYPQGLGGRGVPSAKLI